MTDKLTRADLRVSFRKDDWPRPGRTPTLADLVEVVESEGGRQVIFGDDGWFEDIPNDIRIPYRANGRYLVLPLPESGEDA